MRRIVITAVLVAAGGFATALPLHAASAASAHTVVDVSVLAGCPGGQAYCFSPATVTVTDGNTVTWTNTSGTDHLLYRCDPSACSGTGPGSGTDGGFSYADIPSGGSFSHTFFGPGVYDYYCAIHGFAVMHGVVVVAGTQPPTTPAPPTSAPATTPATSPATTPPTAAPGPGITAPGAPARATAAAATPPTATAAPGLAHTGGSTGGLVAVALACLVAGAAAAGLRRPRLLPAEIGTVGRDDPAGRAARRSRRDRETGARRRGRHLAP